MKHTFPTLLLVLLLAACSGEQKPSSTAAQTAEALDPAAESLSGVERLFSEGRYQECCEAIKQLRKDYPQAISARKRCLAIWDEAQLGIAREELEKAEALLAEAEQKLKTAKSREARLLIENEIDEQRSRCDAERELVKMLTEKIESRPLE